MYNVILIWHLNRDHDSLLRRRVHLNLYIAAICIARSAVAIRIEARGGQVAHIPVLIERLRVCQVRIRNWNRSCAPIWCDEAPQTAAVVSSYHVIKARLAIAFFAGEMTS